MFRFLGLFMCIAAVSFSQTHSAAPLWFKGDHFVIYNKCKTAVLFCESTQQDYTFCGASKNCQGLFVMPGDTFLLNYEDKLQSMTIVADISFQNYLPVSFNHTFVSVNNCIPPQPLQIVIPLNAVNGSSFQINAQNPVYLPAEPFQPGVPLPIYVYVGGQQPSNTSALVSFTNCPVVETADTTSAVSVKELTGFGGFTIYPNPSDDLAIIYSKSELQTIELWSLTGQVLFSETVKDKTHQLQLRNFAQGIYFVKCIDVDGRNNIRKMVVSR